MRRLGLLLVSVAVVALLLRLIAPWSDAVTPFGCALENDCRHPVDAVPVYLLGAVCLVGLIAAAAGVVAALRSPRDSRFQVGLVGAAVIALVAASVFTQTVRIDYSAWKTVVGVDVFADPASGTTVTP